MRRALLTSCWLLLAFAGCSLAEGFQWMCEEMKREGFDETAMRRLSPEYLPLEHNAADAINAEINSSAFRTSLADRLQGDLGADWQVAFRVWALWDKPGSDFWAQHPEELFRMRARGTEHFLWARGRGLSEDHLQRLTALAGRYVEARLAGHTAFFASNCLACAQGPRSASNRPLRAKVLAAHPEIPPPLLVETTNTWSSTWYKPDPQALGGHVAVQLVYHVFRVADGPITWDYYVAEDSPYVEVKKHDSQEDDPVKRPLIAEAGRMVDAGMEKEGTKGQFGSCHAYWGRLKKLLKDKYSIDWLSPKELHPNHEYD